MQINDQSTLLLFFFSFCRIFARLIEKMHISTQGIVLHKVKYSESSIIVKIFTRSHGVQSFMLKGAFSKKNKMQLALIENLSIIDITFEDKNSNIKYWKEISSHYAYQYIPFDMVRMTLSIFYNELIYKLLSDYKTDEALYDFIKKSLLELDSEKVRLTDIHLRFMIQLSKLLGFFPAQNHTEKNCFFSIEEATFVPDYYESPYYLSKPASQYLFELMQDQDSDQFPSKTVRNELLYGLISYFQIHNEQINHIDSVPILTEILQ